MEASNPGGTVPFDQIPPHNLPLQTSQAGWIDESVNDACAILLSDDHNITMAGLRHFLRCPRFGVAGAVPDRRALLRAVKDTNPEIVVADICIQGMDGLETVKLLRQIQPSLKIIVLAARADSDFVSEALAIKVSGLVLKKSAITDLPEAIDIACSGGVFISKMAEESGSDAEPAKPGEPGEVLTKRQREILVLLAEGRSAKEAGAILRISPRTVEFHKYRIMDHLHMHSVAQLARYAVVHGMV